MPSAFADTPPNPWNVKIPAAAHGAPQIPIPQPATKGEASTVAFRDRLRAVASAQIEANGEAFATLQARRDAEACAPSPAARSAQPTPTAIEPAPAPTAAAPHAVAPPSRELASYTPGVPSWPSYAECLKPKPAAGPADPFAMPAGSQSIADRMRARHAVPVASGSVPHAPPAAAEPGASISDRMRARYGLPAETTGSARTPEPTRAALRTAGR